jgi:tetratricopeptide (TPR) repeat protein
MNKFHPPSFRQSLEWTAGILDRGGEVTWADCAPLAFEAGDGRLFDLDMAGIAPVTRERFLERRQHIYEIFAQAFSADCLMMTPGLVEAWRDLTTGLYIHEAPLQRAMAAVPGRWELEVLSYETCLEDMLAALDVVRARNPGVKVLVTTSPVPMSATFSGDDVRVANLYSKSVLRAVCGGAARAREGVDYFPSFESVTLSFPGGVWSEDRIHVAPGFVGKIVAHMLDHYFEGMAGAAGLQQRAHALILSGDFPGAETAARAALEAQPGLGEARRLLADALLRQDRCREAEAELNDLKARSPGRADVLITLARAIFRGDRARAPEAIGLIEAAFALGTISLSDIRAVAHLVRRRAPPETAERLMRRAIELHPDSLLAYSPLTVVLLDQGRLAEAEALMRRAVERFPLHGGAYSPLAEFLMGQGRTPEALAVLERAAALRRPPVALLVRLAELHLDQGRPEAAGAALHKALSLEPGHAGAAELVRRIRTPSVPTADPPARDGIDWSALLRFARPRWSRI